METLVQTLLFQSSNIASIQGYKLFNLCHTSFDKYFIIIQFYIFLITIIYLVLFTILHQMKEF